MLTIFLKDKNVKLQYQLHATTTTNMFSSVASYFDLFYIYLSFEVGKNTALKLSQTLPKKIINDFK
jgi:hypothetical protein